MPTSCSTPCSPKKKDNIFMQISRIDNSATIGNFIDAVSDAAID